MRDEQRPNRTGLPDGRQIAWAEYGEAAGEPVVYCHGFPACRLEARLVADAARRAGVRLIAPDRPGFGASSPAWGRRIRDWPRDLGHLLDALGIARCRVLGMSGGGPYALASGAFLGQRVEAIALTGALGPLDEPTAARGMSGLARLSFHLAREHPRVQGALFHALAPVVRRIPGVLLSQPGPDDAVLQQPGVRDVLLATMRGSMTQGARPAIEELRRYARPWGFALADVCAPVRLYHGEADQVVPPAHGHAIAAELTDAQTRFMAGEGHFSLPTRHMDAILGDLRGAGSGA